MSACGKRTKRAEREKQPPIAPALTSTDENATEEAEGSSGTGSKRTDTGKKDRWRDREEGDERSAKKPRGPNPADHALRRIKHKVSDCLLVEDP